jgi:hypothetical protein
MVVQWLGSEAKRALTGGTLLSRHDTFDGAPCTLCRFAIIGLDAQHIASVAFGPLQDALPSFQRVAWGEQLPPVAASAAASAGEVIPVLKSVAELCRVAKIPTTG